MCGIAGIITFGKKDNKDFIARNLKIILNDMKYRGPDDHGIWINKSGNVGFGHNRLSIIDINKRSRQPMSDFKKQIFTTFNGEIYNFKELKLNLQKDGCKFLTETDTEVLPNLFKDFDYNSLNKLDGMFAFGIWSEIKKTLLLARDLHGKKPLYYTFQKDFFAFCSELKALSKIECFKKQINKEALENYLLFQYIPAPLTIYKGVNKLEPGCFLNLTFDNKNKPEIKIDRYNKFKIKTNKHKLSSYQFKIKNLKELIINAVEKRLMSDVPLGMFLSGGVDSSLVAAIATKELGLKISSFSMGFENDNDSEHILAKQISKHLGTKHFEKLVKPHHMFDIKKVAFLLDEPNGDSSCLPTFMLSKFAKKHVTVALSGDGGDEMFGGYNRYKDTLNEEINWILKIYNFIKRRKFLSPSNRYLSSRYLIFNSLEVQNILGKSSLSFDKLLHNLEKRLNSNEHNLLDRMRQLDSEFYLPGAVLAKVDRMSMLSSLEVRCPLLDVKVSKYAEMLSPEDLWKAPSYTKKILKDLASEYLPKNWLEYPKKGFGIPQNAWKQRDVIKLANETLLHKKSILKNFTVEDNFVQIIKSFENKNNFSIYKIWPLLILEYWFQSNI